MNGTEFYMTSPNGILTMAIEDKFDEIQLEFPNEPFKLSQLSNLYSALKHAQPRFVAATLKSLGSKELQNYLVNTRFDERDGQQLTPLSMAAGTGNVEVVKLLLSNYDVDLECENNFIFDGLVVYGATALWIAAGMGHLQIVKMLVQRGANVNHNTQAQSSPLRAACYEGRMDVVNYLIKHGADVNTINVFNNTCIMIAAHKGNTSVVESLLKHGATVNDQALCGATALHYAAEGGHVDVVNKLLDHGALLVKNELGLTPALQSAEHLRDDVVKTFIQRPGLMSKEDIIECLELLGANYANDKSNNSVTKAFVYMMRAMEMRYSDPKNIIRKRVLEPIPAYDNWIETENIPELLAIQLNHHSIHMEALTIRERILGRHNPNLAQPIVYRGAVMADQGRYDQCQTMWIYALDLRMLNNISVERDLLRFAQLFAQLLREEGHRLSLRQVVPILMKCQQEIDNNHCRISLANTNTNSRLIKVCFSSKLRERIGFKPANALQNHNEQNVITALYLIKIVAHLAERMAADVTPTLIKDLYEVLRKLIRNHTCLPDGRTLLHLAIRSGDYMEDVYVDELYQFPCFRTVQILLRAGASPLSVDVWYNTPLHTLMDTFSQSGNGAQVNLFEDIAEALIAAGAHLDAVNKLGKTAADIARNGVLKGLLRQHQNAHLSLKCMAARIVAKERFCYRGTIPATLESFIQMHSTIKRSE